MQINSWNIKWDRESEKSWKNSQQKSKVASNLLNGRIIDILSLLEAGEQFSPDVDGYKKFYFDRKYIESSIVVYIKECYNPQICIESLKEFEKQKTDCFLPIIIEEPDFGEIHLLFVWTVLKYGEKYPTPYGFNRFDKIFYDSVNFKNTHKFLNGKNHNVVVIGDFNMVYELDDVDKERGKRWEKLIQMMNNRGLGWVENFIPTFNHSVVNDHCFVSEGIKPKLQIGDYKYFEVKSDHAMILLSLEKR